MMNHTWLLLGLIWLTLPGCASQPLSDPATAPTQRADTLPDEFTEQRRLLVERISSQGVSNKAVLAALMKVPRHRFVPSSYKHLAYAERPLPIGHGQTISQPFIVAYMTEAAGVEPGEKVLEIGTGSGYQAAVLSEVAREVYSVEIIPALAENARGLLRRGYIRNIGTCAEVVRKHR
jgi:protein-L-isoaspartate(D-aspartate) O-methyltransferase